MTDLAPQPLLDKAVSAAEALVWAENFSMENLCHALDCGLRELSEAVGSLDDVITHVNDRFMAAYILRATALSAAGLDDLTTVIGLGQLWLEHAVAHPQNMNLLMLHKWSVGFKRPAWYLARVDACFAPMEARLVQLAPQALPAAVAGASRGIYAHICGLYFLSSNERAQPAGIESLRSLLQLTVTLITRGLATPTR